MYRHFDSLPHQSCPQELGMVVAKQKDKSLLFMRPDPFEKV